MLERKEGNQKNDIILDPERAHLVRKLFEIYATGDHSYQAMVKVAEKIGLNNARGKKKGLARAHIYSILQDPFYYGVMHVKSRGEFYPHRYETIISKELFDQCEDVRMGRKRYVGDYDSIDFLFKGMLTCAVTGRKVTSERKRKKKANDEQVEWIYLRTQNPENPDKHVWVREEEIVAQIDTALRSLALADEGMLNDLLTYLHKTHGSKKHVHRTEGRDLKQEHEDIQDRLDKLVDLMIEGRIADDDYQKKHRALKDRQIEIVNRIRSLDTVDGQFAKQMDYLIKVAHGAANIFAGSEISEKRELLKMFFQNLQLRGKNLEYTMASPFDEFAKCQEIAEWWAVLDSN